MARKTTTDTGEGNTATTNTPKQAPQAASETASRTPRPGSKLAQVMALLEAPEGATIRAIMTATGWQQHTVRGALAGSITRKLGHSVSSEKVEGRGRVYRIANPTA